jgi:hypothetical protein
MSNDKTIWKTLPKPHLGRAQNIFTPCVFLLFLKRKVYGINIRNYDFVEQNF